MVLWMFLLACGLPAGDGAVEPDPQWSEPVEETGTVEEAGDTGEVATTAWVGF